MGENYADAPADRDDEIRQVIADFLARRSDGDTVSDAEVLTRFPHLRPELGRQLQLVHLVESAQAQSQRATDAEATTPKAGQNSVTPSQIAGAAAAKSGSWIGRFELIEQLGQGGFATVWKAYDPQLDRWVAVKIPRRADLSASEAELFLREARAASQVQHRHVVRLHEVNRDGDAIYLVSDFIAGLPLDLWVQQQSPAPRAVAQLCELIARALGAIHEAGIVHRDLKPANILIDEQGEPHITDFGLAKRSAEATLTLDGQMLGTPAYMSPEQARGESHTAGIPSDIYSVGVILFELLTGVLPFRGAPHRMLSQTIHDGPPSLRTFDAQIPHDLETVCLRCLEKDPAKRFLSATELANELGRFLRGEPIQSRPIGAVQRAVRWCRRYPLAATLVATLATASIVAPLLAARFRVLADQALTAKTAAESSEREKSELLYVSQMNAVQQAVEQGDSLRAGQLLDAQIPAAGETDLRDFEWYYWQAQRSRGLAWELGPFGMLESVTVSADGEWLAWGGKEGTVTVRNLSTDETYDIPARTDAEGKPLTVYAVLFSPTANMLAIGREASDVAVWSLAEQRERVALPIEGESTFAMAFTADGQTLAAATRGGTLELWKEFDPASRHVIKVTEHSLRSVDFSADGTKIATVIVSYHRSLGGLRCLNVATGETLSAWDDDKKQLGLCARFSPDDSEVYYGADATFSLQRFAGKSFAIQGEFRWESNTDVGPIALSTDGELVIAGGSRGELLAWSRESGEIVENWPGHHDRVMAIAVLPGGKRIVTCGFDGYARCWRIGEVQQRKLSVQFPGNLHYLCFSPDGKRLYLHGRQERDHRLYAWDLSRDELIWKHEGDDPAGGNFVLTGDGSTLITTHGQGQVNFWDAASGQLIEKSVVLRPDRQVCFAAVSPDGKWLATAEGQLGAPPFTNQLTERIFVWDLAKRQVVYRWYAHGRKAVQMLFGPGDDELISYGWDKKIRRWRISTQEQLAEYPMGRIVVRSLMFSDDRKTLVATDAHGVVWRWDLSTGQLAGKLTLRDGNALVTGLSPSGLTLAIPLGPRNRQDTTRGSFVKLIDTRTWEPKCTLMMGEGSAVCSAFSPDGELLVTGGHRGQVYLWHAPRDVDSKAMAAGH